MAAIDNSLCELSVRDGTVRVVQLTDTHLKARSGGTLLGLDTDYSLQAVLDLVKTEYPDPHLILGTGDLADAGASDAYRRLVGYFDQISTHHYWLPGNHDRREVMQDVGGVARVPGEIRVGAWQIIMLDSQIPGEVGGFLGTLELKRLEACLVAGAEAGLHSMVCMHHQPVPIGCAWLDQQMVADAQLFFEILDRFTQVRAVLWGHVHQDVHRQRNDVNLMCTPSTCVQFLPGQTDFAVDTQAPGYRWLELNADGSIETGVSRAEGSVFRVDREANGYL